MSQFSRKHPEFDGDYLDYHSDLADMRDKTDDAVRRPSRPKEFYLGDDHDRMDRQMREMEAERDPNETYHDRYRGTDWE